MKENIQSFQIQHFSEELQSPILQFDYDAEPYFQSSQHYEQFVNQIKQQGCMKKCTQLNIPDKPFLSLHSRSTAASLNFERDENENQDRSQAYDNKIVIPIQQIKSNKVTNGIASSKLFHKRKINKNLLKINGDQEIKLNSYEQLKEFGIHLEYRTINRWAKNSTSHVKLNLGRPVVDPELEKNTMGMIKELNLIGFRVNKPLIETVQNYFGRIVPLKSASHFYKFNKRFDKYLKNQAHDKFRSVDVRDLNQIIWKLRQVSGLYHQKLGKLLTKHKPSESQWKKHFFDSSYHTEELGQVQQYLL